MPVVKLAVNAICLLIIIGLTVTVTYLAVKELAG